MRSTVLNELGNYCKLLEEKYEALNLELQVECFGRWDEIIFNVAAIAHGSSELISLL